MKLIKKCLTSGPAGQKNLIKSHEIGMKILAARTCGAKNSIKSHEDARRVTMWGIQKVTPKTV
tara:strand:- start:76 stop:264 length:189 start_codon:yes stop_codon:yes gene_type:complete